METILITGGSGIIGRRLSELLVQHHFAVRHLSRKSTGTEKYPTFVWNIDEQFIDPKALEGVDHIIHLAGENVGDGRWTATRRKKILSSRIDSAHLILNKMQGQQLKSFISASGISYYGSITSSQIFKETDPCGTDFLANVSVQWEKAAFQFEDIAKRVVALRTGVVLSPTGGALAQLIKPIKLGIGSALGSGKQYMPWLHLEDMCQIYLKAITDEGMVGIYNAASSQHLTNQEMVNALAKTCGKKLWAPKVPGFLLKLLFGEMSVIILEGSRVDNQKIKNAGFVFQYDSLEEALKSLILKK
jgi:uncharacterized protein (TIGR01777 family)